MWAKNWLYKVFLFIIFFFLIPNWADAQPFPCKDSFGCPGGCKEDGVTCYDIDDPVPLDDFILYLLAAGIGFGLYKLHTHRIKNSFQ